MITFQQAVERWGLPSHCIDDQRFIMDSRLVGLVLVPPVNDVWGEEFYLDFDNGYRALSSAVTSFGEANPPIEPGQVSEEPPNFVITPLT